MKERDEIKDLFTERFKEFEAPVDPKIWSGVESSIGGASSGSGIIGLSSKTIWILATAAAVLTSAVVVFTLDQKVPEQQIVSSEEFVQNEEVNLPQNEEAMVEIDEIDTESGDVEDKEGTEATYVVNETTEVVDIPKNDVTEDNNNVKPVIKEEKQDVAIIDEGTTNVISNAPKTINVEQQSKVLASPSGGMAPLEVTFSSISEVEDIKWQFDDGTESSNLNPTHEFEEPGIYFVTMLAKLKDGSVVMDKAVIEVKEPMTDDTSVEVESSDIFVPNIFTPNGDGENDELVIKLEGIHSYTISIYSVNGELVYTSGNPDKNWDGTDMRGRKVEDGTYYYLVNALGEDQKVYSPKGYITIRSGY